MSNKGSQVLGVIVAVFAGLLLSYVVHNLRSSPVAQSSPSPEVASPSPSLAPSPLPQPSPEPTEAPSPSPSPTPTPTGPAAIPAQLTAGTTYTVRPPSGSVFAFASDSVDGGTLACAGINDESQTFPAGYEGSYFVMVRFPDGTRLYAGYLRYQDGPRQDFAEVQRGGGTFPASGPAGAATASGSHKYCVTHGSGGWTMTDDGNAIPCPGCPSEAAGSLSGALVQFESSVQFIPGSAGTAKTTVNLVVPGFHDLSVGGVAPRELKGAVQYA